MHELSAALVSTMAVSDVDNREIGPQLQEIRPVPQIPDVSHNVARNTSCTNLGPGCVVGGTAAVGGQPDRQSWSSARELVDTTSLKTRASCDDLPPGSRQFWLKSSWTSDFHGGLSQDGISPGSREVLRYFLTCVVWRCASCGLRLRQPLASNQSSSPCVRDRASAQPSGRRSRS